MPEISHPRRVNNFAAETFARLARRIAYKEIAPYEPLNRGRQPNEMLYPPLRKSQRVGAKNRRQGLTSRLVNDFLSSLYREKMERMGNFPGVKYRAALYRKRQPSLPTGISGLPASQMVKIKAR